MCVYSRYKLYCNKYNFKPLELLTHKLSKRLKWIFNLGINLNIING